MLQYRETTYKVPDDMNVELVTQKTIKMVPMLNHFECLGCHHKENWIPVDLDTMGGIRGRNFYEYYFKCPGCGDTHKIYLEDEGDGIITRFTAYDDEFDTGSGGQGS